MNNIIVRIALHPKKYLAKLLLMFSFCLSDKQCLKALFMYRFGYSLDLENPKTFCEKLQWLKLYDRKPEYTRMVDKYEVKKYVADKIGNEYIIPTLGVWDAPEDIEWEELPNQFVLKTTHGGGGNGVIICKDKTKLDIKAVCKQLHKSLNSDLYKTFREWPYKNVSKRIIAEKFMVSQVASVPNDLPDYKFYCFDGEPKYCQVIRDRHDKETIDFYDINWVHQEFVGLNPVARNGQTQVARPKNLDKMVDICRRLSAKLKFSRIDLYIIDDKEFFGEITLYPASGFGEFTPSEWNNRLGDLIKLSGIQTGGGKLYLTVME